MKPILLAIGLLAAMGATAQTDSLSSGVYHIQKTAGVTTDLAMLKTHITTLNPGQTNHPPRALDSVEELIIVKDGQLAITINDSTKTLGPGSLAFIMPGDRQSFRNPTGNPVLYFVMSFASPDGPKKSRGRKGGGSQMIDWNTLVAKTTDKGESRPIFDRPSAMFARFEIHATLLNAGKESHAPHTHREEEAMLLMDGFATGNIDGKDQTVSIGDFILMRPNIPHNIKNTGTVPCWYYAMKWVD
ncbi:MAG: cupin domain-containing protein [Bacteroidetes bacterium]|nr:cupin domain-containing protein [Bacteroidota bacterium]